MSSKSDAVETESAPKKAVEGGAEAPTTDATGELDRAFRDGRFLDLRALVKKLEEGSEARLHGDALVARTRPRREETALLVLTAALLVALSAYWYANRGPADAPEAPQRIDIIR